MSNDITIGDLFQSTGSPMIADIVMMNERFSE